MITLAALIGSDPHFDALWNARAACTIPSNASTLTTRITTFTYDVEGRLAQVNSPEGVINYDYDLITGRHVGTCTQNSETTYEYDALGRLWKVHAIKRNGVTINETTVYTYTVVGSRDTVTLPNGVVTAYQYDELNRLTNLVNKASNNAILSQFNYKLDLTGRRTNATEIIKQEDAAYQTNTLSWAFDGLYRLTNEVCVSTVSGGSYTNAYQYDKAGNRYQRTRKVAAQTETIKSYYNNNDQLLREEITPLSGSLNTNYYAYDANGSLTAKTNASASTSTPMLYTYDLKNKLSSVAAYNGSTWTTNYFVYNESGVRVRTTPSSGSATLYLVDANNHTGYAQVLEELIVLGGTPTTSYVLGDDVLAQAIGSSIASYLLYDGHGSTRQLAPNTANTTSVTSRYNYDAYGVTLTSTSSSAAETSLLYCGEQYDNTLNMYNLRARFYNPSNGRFNARDTFAGTREDPQSLHKYAYGANDPIGNVDPNGKSFFAFDGTNNYPEQTDKGQSAPTNVYKLYLASNDPNFFYAGGPGNPNDFHGPDRAAGLAFGYGMSQILERAMEELKKHREAGDKQVDIIGFSRGGIEATEFANLVAEEYPDEIIRFVGLFDPVGSVGYPGGFGDYRFELPAGVQHAVEAMAANENRAMFPGTSVSGATQQWFRGVHSDIGGGYADHRLSDVVLIWMAEQAGCAGVSLDLSKSVTGTGIQITPDPSAPINLNHGFTSWFTRKSGRYVITDVDYYIMPF